MSVSRNLYFVAGEASGDLHGASLIGALRQLNSEVQFLGRGGPRMKKIAGGHFLDWSKQSSVLGLWEVLRQYGYFREQFHATIQDILDQRPRAVVLIDYPGFNLRLARALRAQLPALKIIFYISPQVWAWNRRRIPQMARSLDLMLCIFPFEAELYNKSGLRTLFVGHPMMESLQARRSPDSRNPDLVALFPGSRLREVRKILPVMLKAAQRILEARPSTSFEIAVISRMLLPEVEQIVRRSRVSGSLIRTNLGEGAAAMQRSQVAIVASGTATLEAAYFRLPFVLVYRVAWPTYFAARLLLKVKHLGMPNVLAGREIVPEFIQHRAKPSWIANAVLQLLNDSARRSSMVSDFDAIIARLGEEGASLNAARAILKEVGSGGGGLTCEGAGIGAGYHDRPAS